MPAAISTIPSIHQTVFILYLLAYDPSALKSKYSAKRPVPPWRTSPPIVAPLRNFCLPRKTSAVTLRIQATDKSPTSTVPTHHIMIYDLLCKRHQSVTVRSIIHYGRKGKCYPARSECRSRHLSFQPEPCTINARYT